MAKGFFPFNSTQAKIVIGGTVVGLSLLYLNVTAHPTLYGPTVQGNLGQRIELVAPDSQEISITAFKRKEHGPFGTVILEVAVDEGAALQRPTYLGRGEYILKLNDSNPPMLVHLKLNGDTLETMISQSPPKN
ncbi:MAG: hypothetical protein V1702_03570 [Candidatus Woesearchaeota archaeon]